MTDAKKTENYAMANRHEGFDFDHMKLVIEEIAKLHATSWAFKQSRGIQKLSSKYPFLLDTLVDQRTGDLDHNHPIVEAMKTVIIPSLEVVRRGLTERDQPEIFKSVERLCGDAEAAVRKSFAFIQPQGIDEAEVESWLRIPPQPIDNYNSGKSQ